MRYGLASATASWPADSNNSAEGCCPTSSRSAPSARHGFVRHSAHGNARAADDSALQVQRCCHGNQRKLVACAVAHLQIVAMRRVRGRGQVDRHDQLVRLQCGVDLSVSPGSRWKSANRMVRSRFGLVPERLPSRGGQRDAQIGRLHCNAVFTRPQNRVGPIESGQRATSRPGRPLATLRKAGIHEIRAPGPAAAGCRHWSPGCAIAAMPRRESPCDTRGYRCRTSG